MPPVCLNSIDRKKAAEVVIRCTSMHAASVCPGGRCAGSLHLSILFFQNASPAGSASRFRKSRYCCRTKVVVSSFAFGVGEAESLIVTIAVDGTMNAAPFVEYDNFTENVSAPSV